MKKPVLSIDEPEPKRRHGADRAPTEGFVVIVDGHFNRSSIPSRRRRPRAGKLKSHIRWLQIEIYDAATRVARC